MMGGAISAPTMLGILNGCSVTNEPNWTPVFFDDKQALTIMEIADIIIPATDTPGALDVGVPQFIESMVKEVYPDESRQEFMDGFSAFVKSVEEEFRKPFIELEKETKVTYINSLNAVAVESSGKAGKEGFFMSVKEMTVGGFCTSEAGATQVLKYDKVPGEYHGCVPYEEIGKTWAT